MLILPQQTPTFDTPGSPPLTQHISPVRKMNVDISSGSSESAFVRLQNTSCWTKYCPASQQRSKPRSTYTKKNFRSPEGHDVTHADTRCIAILTLTSVQHPLSVEVVHVELLAACVVGRDDQSYPVPLAFALNIQRYNIHQRPTVYFSLPFCSNRSLALLESRFIHCPRLDTRPPPQPPGLVQPTPKMRNNMALGWFYSPSQIRHYVTSRVTSLRPPRTKMQNPITILRQLDSHHWLMFWVGFAGW